MTKYKITKDDTWAELTGSQKQVAWAEDIRKDYANQFNSLVKNYDEGLKKGYDKGRETAADRETSDKIYKWEGVRNRLTELTVGYDSKYDEPIRIGDIIYEKMSGNRHMSYEQEMKVTHSEIKRNIKAAAEYWKKNLQEKKSASWWINNFG